MQVVRPQFTATVQPFNRLHTLLTYGAEQNKGFKMEKYAKIIDNETKEVQIGVGCTDEYYIEIGMTLMDVEQAYNGLWYKSGYAPEEPEEDKQAKVRLIRDTYLQQYDFTQLDDAPFTAEEKAVYARYRQYLRDYTKEENWWEAEPKTYNEWAATTAEEN